MDQSKKELKSIIKSLLNTKSQEDLNKIIDKICNIKNINKDVCYACQKINKGKDVLSNKIDDINDICTEYIVENYLKEANEGSYVIGLSKNSNTDIANGYNDYDCYIKDIIENAEDLVDPNKLGYITTTNINEAKIFTDKQKADSYVKTLKNETDWKTISTISYTKKEEALSSSDIFANLSQIQKTIQQKTGCTVTIESDKNTITIVISGDSNNLMNAMTYGDEIRKYFEDLNNEVTFETQNNKFIYTIKSN